MFVIQETHNQTSNTKYFTVVYVFSLVTSNPRLDNPSSVTHTP